MKIIQSVFLWISVISLSLMLGGNLYEQVVIVRYMGSNMPDTLWFWQDILNTGTFDFYLLAPIALFALLISVVLCWKQQGLRWLILASFGSMVINTIMTFMLALPVLEVLLFPLDKHNTQNAGDLHGPMVFFAVISVVRWLVTFAGMICLLIVFGRLYALRTRPALSMQPAL